MNLSAGWLLASLAASSAGIALLAYGKKQTRFPQLLAGLALLVESACVPSTAWMLAGAALVLALLWAALRAGL